MVTLKQLMACDLSNKGCCEKNFRGYKFQLKGRSIVVVLKRFELRNSTISGSEPICGTLLYYLVPTAL